MPVSFSEPSFGGRKMSTTLVSIRGLSRPEVLAALFNAAEALDGRQVSMTVDQAEELFRGKWIFVELEGKRLNLVFYQGDFLDVYGYDKFNGGYGTAEKVIKALRESRQAS